MTKKEKDFLKFGIVSKIFYPESSNFVPNYGRPPHESWTVRTNLFGAVRTIIIVHSFCLIIFIYTYAIKIVSKIKISDFISRFKIFEKTMLIKLALRWIFWPPTHCVGGRYWWYCRKRELKKENFLKTPKVISHMVIFHVDFKYHEFWKKIQESQRFETILSISPPTQFVGGSEFQHTANFWC